MTDHLIATCVCVGMCNRALFYKDVKLSIEWVNLPEISLNLCRAKRKWQISKKKLRFEYTEIIKNNHKNIIYLTFLHANWPIPITITYNYNFQYTKGSTEYIQVVYIPVYWKLDIFIF